MKWLGGNRSGNVEDRRGMGGKFAVGGGLGAIVIAIISMLLGGNPLENINLGAGQSQEVAESVSPEDDKKAEFVSVVLKYTEDVWGQIFKDELNTTYPQPALVLFT